MLFLIHKEVALWAGFFFAGCGRAVLLTERTQPISAEIHQNKATMQSELTSCVCWFPGRTCELGLCTTSALQPAAASHPAGLHQLSAWGSWRWAAKDSMSFMAV